MSHDKFIKNTIYSCSLPKSYKFALSLCEDSICSTGADYKDAFECSVEGLPEDIDITFPVVTASAYSYTFGTPTSVCRLKGKTLSCEGRLAFEEGANQGDFINIFIVRNGGGKIATEGNDADTDSDSDDINQ